MNGALMIRQPEPFDSVPWSELLCELIHITPLRKRKECVIDRDFDMSSSHDSSIFHNTTLDGSEMIVCSLICPVCTMPSGFLDTVLLQKCMRIQYTLTGFTTNAVKYRARSTGGNQTSTRIRIAI